VILGGGRERKEDSVDPAVGMVLHKKVGDQVSAGEALATVYYNTDARAERAQQLISSSCEIAEVAPSKRPLVRRIIGKSGGTN
jgi:thymidine phosphorylase